MAHDVKLKTKPSEITREGDAWILHFPRFGAEGTHYHTYGLLTPYFEGLAQGRLMATRCVNAKCPIGRGKGEMWLPPRADCPDCHQPMKWEEVKNPRGYIYSYTYVERGGTGLEIECPYYQVDVRIEGVGTIFKGYLLDRKPIKIGDKVRAVFRTGSDATNTCLDIAWELV
ncbi:MAG: OB-fold domain-containing protein [Candidatus Krumholzibacteria bacterium]|nr:OB-fold domain-containing protein [Candidatus Krumholzibacteria bacterium]